MRRGRVLIVEDDAFIGEDMSEELRKLGLEVVGPARSAAEADRLLDATGLVDGAVLNLGIRSGPSFDVAARLKTLGIRFVFASGHTSEVVPDAFAGIAFLRKPVQPREIVRVLFPEQAAGTGPETPR
jgi:DNA-binding response OmpR family regulator